MSTRSTRFREEAARSNAAAIQHLKGFCKQRGPAEPKLDFIKLKSNIRGRLNSLTPYLQQAHSLVTLTKERRSRDSINSEHMRIEMAPATTFFTIRDFLEQLYCSACDKKDLDALVLIGSAVHKLLADLRRNFLSEQYYTEYSEILQLQLDARSNSVEKVRKNVIAALEDAPDRLDAQLPDLLV